MPDGRQVSTNPSHPVSGWSSPQWFDRWRTGRTALSGRVSACRSPPGLSAQAEHTTQTWAFVVLCMALVLQNIASFDVQTAQWRFARVMLLADMLLPAA